MKDESYSTDMLHDIKSNNDINNNDNNNTSSNKKGKSNDDDFVFSSQNRFKQAWELIRMSNADISSREEILYQYSCTMYKDSKYVHGYLFITPSWFSFTAAQQTPVTLQWSHITEMTEEKTAKAVSDAVRILTNNVVMLYFSMFVKFEEAYTTIHRVWDAKKASQIIERFQSSLVISNQEDGLQGDSKIPILTTVDKTDVEVQCPCLDDHNGVEYINEELNIDVDSLYDHLFSPYSDVMRLVFMQRKWEKASYSPFIKAEDGTISRTVTYTIPVGLKRANTTTKHCMSKQNTPSSFYVMHQESTTSGVPYDDDFSVNTRYCITRCCDNKCRLRVTSEVIFTKKLSALARKIVTKGAHEGMKDFANSLKGVLKSESDLLSGTDASSMLRVKTKKKEKSMQMKYPE